ncbi:MAG TPA: DUF2911 domain-containing protein [Pseudobacter sp.]|nr:DUF2911 domain-containing protein [Pseudobacter sp.]
MKKLLFLSTMLLSATILFAQQDKEKRPSPPAKATATIQSGAAVTIDYSQPSVKGRTIGKEIAPYGEVWRTGANEATVFEVSKDVTIDGKALPAGKYGLFTIPGENEWVLIFNKTWQQWGAYKYKADDDVLRVTVKPVKAPTASERMTFTVSENGQVNLLWGDVSVPFVVK